MRCAELLMIENMLDRLKTLGRVDELAFVESPSGSLPIYKISFGSQSPTAPVLGLVGGVHGLERIGSQVVLSLLNSFTNLLLWDRTFQQILNHIRIFFIPAVNPYGLTYKTRSNPRSVDLMRNAPLVAEGKTPFLVGGHRYSKRLPWYQGELNAGMELEAQVLVDTVLQEISQAEASICMDFHSGFGLQDQIWFPHAYTTKKFPELAEVHSFFTLLETTYPHHFYKIEPQAINYTTHGDLWDYIYLEHRKKHNSIFLPLCLEMGSWSWVRKNPMQIMHSGGIFNPIKVHRLKRALRRHNTLFDFLIRSLHSHQVWSQLTAEQKKRQYEEALLKWYN